MKTIRVSLEDRSYAIHIGSGVLRSLPRLIRANGLGRVAIIITTPRVHRLLGRLVSGELRRAGVDIHILEVPDTEKSKSADEALRLIEKITRLEKSRKVFLVALGGGVVGDLTGFVAAIYKRGIPYIQIPTTLLAQIDSSIGGKTAVDTAFGKNLIGAFHQPRLVLSDTRLLKTLPRRQILSGLAEGIKYGAIHDASFFAFIEKAIDQILALEPGATSRLIETSSRIKAGIVSRDERDTKDARIILNFGHTFGHAVEAASRFKITHGEAVAIGMVLACRLSEKLGLLDAASARRVSRLIQKAGLPATIPSFVKTASILKALAHDKKFSRGKTRFVCLTRIGQTRIKENVSPALIQNLIKER
jgi:3-dehydroquinate synthase